MQYTAGRSCDTCDILTSKETNVEDNIVDEAYTTLNTAGYFEHGKH